MDFIDMNLKVIFESCDVSKLMRLCRAICVNTILIHMCALFMLRKYGVSLN